MVHTSTQHVTCTYRDCTDSPWLCADDVTLRSFAIQDSIIQNILTKLQTHTHTHTHVHTHARTHTHTYTHTHVHTHTHTYTHTHVHTHTRTHTRTHTHTYTHIIIRANQQTALRRGSSRHSSFPWAFLSTTTDPSKKYRVRTIEVLPVAGYISISCKCTAGYRLHA